MDGRRADRGGSRRVGQLWATEISIGSETHLFLHQLRRRAAPISRSGWRREARGSSGRQQIRSGGRVLPPCRGGAGRRAPSGSIGMADEQ
ncbi:hypothetical protein ACLOJK_024164, partial [Asimina triloba]